MRILEDPRVVSLLETLESSIDPATEEDLLAQWKDFWFAPHAQSFAFRPQRKTHATAVPPQVFINDTLPDTEEGYIQMLLQQYGGALGTLHGNGIPCVRANYGVGILASPFGTPLFLMEREQNTLPNVRSLGIDNIEALIDRGIPAPDAGLLGQVFHCADLFAEIARRYPKIGQYVYVIHPDLQGPTDVAELVCGSELFYLLYDEPEQSAALLQLLTDTYRMVIDRWLGYFPYNGSYSAHWGVIQRGALMIRADSSMNLSPDMYREFVAPYDSQLLGQYGGCVHFCGRGDHYIEQTAAISGMYGIQMSQPELNDMEKIHQFTTERGIPLLTFPMGNGDYPHLAGVTRA